MTKYHLTADILTSYGKYLQQEERSPATVEKYMRDLRGFSAWLEGRAVTKRLAASFRHSFLGSRMVRIFPLRDTSARWAWTASTVIYRTSLTRMPVAQIVSIINASCSRPSLEKLQNDVLAHATNFEMEALLLHKIFPARHANAGKGIAQPHIYGKIAAANCSKAVFSIMNTGSYFF